MVCASCLRLALAAAIAGAAVTGDPAVRAAGDTGSDSGAGAQCGDGGDAETASLLQSRVQRAEENVWQGQRFTMDKPGAPLRSLPEIDTASGTAELQVQVLQVCLPPELTNWKSDQSCFYTRAFGTPEIAPSLPGPTLRMTAGTTVKVHYANMLTKPDPCPNTPHNPGLFCNPNTTNLHVHGLHVSPQKGSDDIWTQIHPGQSSDYEYWIPPNHMAGTFFYHPHWHHATSIQAGGGAAGAIIMQDPPNSLPPQVQDITEIILVMTMMNAAASSNNLMVGVWGNPALENMAKGNLWKYPNGHQVNLASQVVLINGQYKPTLKVESGKWYRFRMIYTAVWSVTLARVLDMDGGTCELQLLSKDGIYLNEVPRAVTAVYFASGNRVDVAIRCVCKGEKVCSTAMASADSPTTPQVFQQGAGKKFLNEGAQQAAEDGHMKGVAQTVIQQVLMSIDIQPGGNTQPDLPKFSVTKPCYLVDLTQVNVPKSNQGRLELTNPDVFAIKWAGSLKGGKTKGHPMTHMSQSSWTSLKVGQVYEYNLVGDHQNNKYGQWSKGNGLALHPVHMHVNPYQIVDLTHPNKSSNAFYQNGDWADTLLWPGMSAIVKFQTDYFTGHEVVHCHILAHEDQGMMGWFNIKGQEGTRWSGAQEVDPTCYIDYGGAGYTLQKR